MNREKKIIISITGIIIVILALLGITYAYFVTQIQGNSNDKSIEVTTANLRLLYQDGNGTITASNIMPGTVITAKTFSVTNEGNKKIDNYGVFLENVINTFSRTQDLSVSLICKQYNKNDYESDGENASEEGMCDGFNGIMPNNNDLIVSNSIDVDLIQVFSFSLTYLETNTDQSEDMNKTLSAKINIYGLDDTVDLKGTLIGYQENDYVEVNSIPKRSKLNDDGSFKIVGLLPESHILNVYHKDSEEPYLTQSFTISKGTVPSITEFNIVITNETRTFDMIVNVTNSKVTSSNLQNYNPFKEGTLANNIYENKALVYGEKAKEKIVDRNACNDARESCLADVRDYGTSFNASYQAPCLEKNDNECIEAGYFKEEIVGQNVVNVNKIQNNPDFSTIVSSTMPNNIGLFKTYDNYGVSYYFRGNIANNYITFNNMCFRITRIEGDGSVKLILADKDHVCSGTNGIDNILNSTTTSSFISEEASYGSDFNGVPNYVNSIDSSMRNVLMNWYNTTLSDTSKEKVKQNSEWCITPPNNNTFICPSTSTKDINYVGTLTQEDIIFSGARLGRPEPCITYSDGNFEETCMLSYNNESYIRTNSYGDYWTLSYDDNEHNPPLQHFYAWFETYDSASNIYFIRPMIVLKNDISVTGDGTLNNPYVIS